MPLSAEAERRAVSPDRTVSVIIPARNEGRTIARLIHAIQQQAPAGWSVEVVLVDDGSTDDTVAVARDAGARVLELGEPGGRRQSRGGPEPRRAGRHGRSARLPRRRLPAGRRLAGAAARRPRRGRGGGRRLARSASRAPAHGPLRLLLRLVSRPLPPPRGRGAQPSTRQPERAPRRLRAHAAASPSSSRSPTRTRSWPGRRRSAGAAARSCSIPRRSSSTTTGPASAICSAGTTAGATAPSRARRRPARPAWRGSIAIPPCWWPRASRSRSEAPATSCGCWVRAGILEPLLMLPGGAGRAAGLLGRARRGRHPLDALRGGRGRGAAAVGMSDGPLVSVVMPCLNEEAAIGPCIEKIQAGPSPGRHRRRDRRVRQRLDRRARSRSPSGWARGSCTSRSRGYGNAYLKGFASARGRYLVMGDADDTYDFTMIPEFVGALARRRPRSSSPAAATSAAATRNITALHRYFGNPALTRILNVLFGTRYTDVYCGFRAFSRESLRADPAGEPGHGVQSGARHQRRARRPPGTARSRSCSRPARASRSCGPSATAGGACG